MIPRDGTCRSSGRSIGDKNHSLGDSEGEEWSSCRPASAAVVDRFLDVDTAGRVDLAVFGLEAPERVDYEAGGWRRPAPKKVS
jgi:hypothetical protein